MTETKRLPAIPWYLINPKDGTELVLVPGGWFKMGSGDEDKEAGSNEKPQHLHYVEPYYIGIACVMVGQFKKFVQETKHDARKKWQDDPDEYPVRYVNLDDAQSYAKWAELRLPTEAEWELAARGYEGRKYPWGSEWEYGRRVCWDGQKGPKGETCPAYAHPEGAGPFGTLQQIGNVWEMCEDWYEENAYKRYATGDFSPTGVRRGHVLRGGSWYHRDHVTYDFRDGRRIIDRPGAPTRHLRVGSRLISRPGEPSLHYLGFRMARTI